MTEAEKWQRAVARASSGGICEVCGAPLGTKAQGAHRIANTKSNRAKYGDLVIDHPLNIAMVCSLACNQVCNIGQDPGKSLRLVEKIIKSELRRFPE